MQNKPRARAKESVLVNMVFTLVASGLIFVSLFASIVFFPTVKIGKTSVGSYWLIALIGAVILLVFGAVPFGEIVKDLTADSAVNPLKILILFFSMTFLSVFLDEAGLFRYLAEKAVALAGKNQFSVFAIVYLLTAVLTVFTSNDIVILTLTPFICYFCHNAKIDPVPYLVGEFAAANTWSMMLVIGNPTNIYLSSFAGIGFAEYLKVMALPTFVAGVTEFAVILLLFGRRLKKPIEIKTVKTVIESKADIVVGLVHIAACLGFLIISGYLGVEMWAVSAICAGSLFLCIIVIRLIKRKGAHFIVNTVKRLPWQLIPFVLSMFVIVISLRYRGITDIITEALGTNGTVWTYGFSSFVAANVINNIPMSILYCTVISPLPSGVFIKAIYATVIGSNVGAFLTPIGALAGIMFTALNKEHGVGYGFKEFVKYGLIISLPTVAAALGTLALVL